MITSTLVPLDQRETPNPTDGHQAFFKTDSRFTDRHSMSLRYRADSNKSTGNSIGGMGGLATRERGTNGDSLVQDIVGNFTSVLSSRALNELRVQFGRQSTWTTIDGWSTLGMPEINRPTLRTGKAYNDPQGRNENRWQFINNFTYTLKIARPEDRRRHQFHSRADLLSAQRRRHVHVHDRPAVRPE